MGLERSRSEEKPKKTERRPGKIERWLMYQFGRGGKQTKAAEHYAALLHRHDSIPKSVKEATVPALQGWRETAEGRVDVLTQVLASASEDFGLLTRHFGFGGSEELIESAVDFHNQLIRHLEKEDKNKDTLDSMLHVSGVNIQSQDEVGLQSTTTPPAIQSPVSRPVRPAVTA